MSAHDSPSSPSPKPGHDFVASRFLKGCGYYMGGDPDCGYAYCGRTEAEHVAEMSAPKPEMLEKAQKIVNSWETKEALVWRVALAMEEAARGPVHAKGMCHGAGECSEAKLLSEVVRLEEALRASEAEVAEAQGQIVAEAQAHEICDRVKNERIQVAEAEVIEQTSKAESWEQEYNLERLRGVAARGEVESLTREREKALAWADSEVTTTRASEARMLRRLEERNVEVESLRKERDEADTKRRTWMATDHGIVDLRTCSVCRLEYPDFGHSSHMKCASCRVGAARAEATKAERERCALIAKEVGDTAHAHHEEKPPPEPREYYHWLRGRCESGAWIEEKIREEPTEERESKLCERHQWPVGHGPCDCGPCPWCAPSSPPPPTEEPRIFGKCNAFCLWFVTGEHVEGCMAVQSPSPEHGGGKA